MKTFPTTKTKKQKTKPKPKTQKIATTCFVDEMPVQQIQSGNEKLMGILI